MKILWAPPPKGEARRLRRNGSINCNLKQAPQYEPGGALCSESKSTMIAGGNHLIIHGHNGAAITAGLSGQDRLWEASPQKNKSSRDSCHSCFGVYLLTTLTGLPARKAATLDTVQSMIRWRLSLGAQEMWGVMMQFFAVSKGLSFLMGSVDTTSRPAA